MKWLGHIPWSYLITFAILMALLPIWPEPHLVEKLRMLASGDLTRPIDILDLFWHSLPLWLMLLKFVHEQRKDQDQDR